MFIKKMTLFATLCLCPIFTMAQSLNEFTELPDDASAKMDVMVIEHMLNEGEVQNMDQINISHPSEGCIQQIGSIGESDIFGDVTAQAFVAGDVYNICDGF